MSEILRMLSTMIDQKGEYIWGHAERVAGNCVKFAKQLDLPKGETDRIYLAALLHDIGMIYIPPDIIHKPDKLSDKEMDVIRQHPLIAEKILAPISVFKEVVPIIRHHHEFYDGSGYPDGLQKDEIPIGSRILCLIDSYEAMIAPRAHRPPMSSEAALGFITEHVRKRFDPVLSRSFRDFIKSTPSIPAEIEKEHTTIEMRNAIRDIVQKLKHGEIEMPVLPKVIGEIQRVINDPHSTSDDLSRLIERDAVVSVKMITVCNSSVYRGAEAFTTVRQAVTRLGITQVNSIITALASRNLYRTNNKKFRKMMEQLWLHSLATAYAARALGRKLGSDDPERLFLMGLLHDIGMTLLIKALEEMLHPDEEHDLKSVIKAIKEFHTSVGAALLDRWKFPKDFARVAEQHEGPHFFETTLNDVLIVNIANTLAGTLGYRMFDDEEQDLWQLESIQLLKMKPDIVFGVTETTEEIMKESAGVF